MWSRGPWCVKVKPRSHVRGRALMEKCGELILPQQQHSPGLLSSHSLPSTLCLLTPVRLSQSLRQTIPNSSLHQQAPETAPRLLTCGATPSFLRRPTVPLCPKQAGGLWEGMMTPLRSDQASHRASLGGLPHVHPQTAPQTAFLAGTEIAVQQGKRTCLDWSSWPGATPELSDLPVPWACPI